ncbi:MAG: hypothetical protein AAF567_03275 [Actinomycetota bacterium]
MTSVRDAATDCLGATTPLSLRRDVFGVYGDNNRTRSLRDQLDLILNRPFVRLALVTVRPAGSALGQYVNLQRDLDAANEVWQSDLGAWIYCTGVATVASDVLGGNGVLNQPGCPLGIQAAPTAEEDALFDIGRGLGADLVGYYIAGSTNPNLAGCSAYPAGRRGFWVRFNATQWTLAHELTHVVGLTPHVPNMPATNSDNLMWPSTVGWTKLPPDLNAAQSVGILNDPGIEQC